MFNFGIAVIFFHKNRFYCVIRILETFDLNLLIWMIATNMQFWFTL